MRKASIPWKAKQYKSMFDQGNLSSDYPIQRGGGQWDSEQKSLFVHSMIEGYPIPNVLLLKREEDTVTYILDGKQRLTTLIDFLSGTKGEDGSYPDTAFRLDEDMPEVRLDGNVYDISGMYYDELPQELRDEARTASISSTRLEDATDDEIEELFFRWNNGTPLTEQQKTRVLMGTANARIFSELLKHPFMTDRATFTPAGRLKGKDEGVLLQAMILLSGYDYKSFVAKELSRYARSVRNESIDEVADIIKQALDFLYENTSPNKNVLYKILHLPTLIMIGINAMDEDYSKGLIDDWITDFSMAINAKNNVNARIQTDYTEYTGAGSIRRSKVEGRMKAMMDHFAEFSKDYVYGDSEKIKELTESETNTETPESHLTDDSTSNHDEVTEGGEEAIIDHSGSSEENTENETLETLPEGTEDHPDDYKDDEFVQHVEHEEQAIQLQEQGQEEVKN